MKKVVGMVLGMAVGVGGALGAEGERFEDAVRGEAMRLTLYYENDGGWAKSWDKHDRHYTAGAGMSLAWRAPWVDRLLKPVPSLFGEFDGEKTTYAMGFVGALTMFTPEDIGRATPIEDDRPYAGWTYGGLFFQRAVQASPDFTWVDDRGIRDLWNPARYSSLETVEVDVGIVGPSSLAQNAQEMVHHAYGYIYPQGWNYQVRDEPEFAIKYNRRWASPRMGLWESNFGFDVIPDVGITTGSLMNEAHAGMMMRLGYSLPSDFGPGEMQNPSAFVDRREEVPNSVYVFARPFGKVVGHNVLLQGGNWGAEDPVTTGVEPLVGGVQVGVVGRFLKYFEAGYVTTFQSPEFGGQRGWDSWSSVQFSFSYAW